MNSNEILLENLLINLGKGKRHCRVKFGKVNYLVDAEITNIDLKDIHWLPVTLDIDPKYGLLEEVEKIEDVVGFGGYDYDDHPIRVTKIKVPAKTARVALSAIKEYFKKDE